MTDSTTDTPPTPRAEPESLRGQALQASLTVKDLDASVHWYHDVVGFHIDRRIEHEGQLRAVAVVAGNVRLLLNKDDGAKGMDRVKGEGFSLMIRTTQSVDDIAGRIQSQGGALITEPADMPWGMRAFRVVDPDGFNWTIASDLP